MDKLKESAIKSIDDKAKLIEEVNDKIWEYAELSLLEFKSAALYCNVLKEEGFEVNENLCGIKTAFSASYGKGSPVIGILAEYDALSGISQKGGVTQKEALKEGRPGHGCGHNILGAGSLAAVIGIKKYLEESKKSGTVVFYGCPGEEGGAGKAFMARDGEFYKLDAALTWHPGSVNEVTTGSCNSSIQIEYKFDGVSTHAAGDPHLGRSALDAVEIMNIGVQFLREHIIDSARIHYAITDAGGYSPNVVQPTAKVLYMIRSSKVKEALELVKRVDKIAEGAALMTETKMSKTFIDGTAETVSNEVLENLLYKCFLEVGANTYDEKEKYFASELIKSYENSKETLPGYGANEFNDIHDFVKENIKGKSICDFIVPYKYSRKQRMGSTDVGDVSWQTPTAQINAATYPLNSPGHSWQNVASGNTSLAHKGAITAGKVLTLAAINLFENSSIIEKAKKEHKNKTADGYNCPIPKDAKPIAIGDGTENK